MSRTHARQSNPRVRRSAAGGDAYVTRMLGCLILSLGLTLTLVHLPLPGRLHAVGWYVTSAPERLSVQHIDPVVADVAGERPASTAFGTATEPISRTSESDDNQSSDALRPDEREPIRRIEPIMGRQVFDFAERMPQIVGGIGAYYIHIEYPDAARELGIEGRLVLSFVVDTEGKTQDIEVVQSLHPACDSAAVQALRRTRFVPGHQDGEPVEVRMRLPVRFQLIPRAPVTPSSGSSADRVGLGGSAQIADGKLLAANAPLPALLCTPVRVPHPEDGITAVLAHFEDAFDGIRSAIKEPPLPANLQLELVGATPVIEAPIVDVGYDSPSSQERV